MPEDKVKSTNTKRIGVVAFSGGLDTSFLIPFSREKYELDQVVTCTVNTGGFGPEEEKQIAARSKECGADEHFFIDAQLEFYNTVIKHLIFGNVSRDGYPLSVGSERIIQAQKVLEICLKKGAEYFFHGSTGAGNDQYRFDVALHVLGQGKVTCVAPVRDFNFSREFSTNFLKEKGISIPQKNSNYSYNVGLWGVSIGGKETHTSTQLIPEDAWYSKPEAGKSEDKVKITFSKGEPISVSSSTENAVGPVECIKLLTKIGNSLSVGRKYHTGTSIPGKKGRLAYEAPAAEILYDAHRTLEKLVLTQAQIQTKQFVANEVGKLIHEAKTFDPYLEDLYAYLASSQRRVSGECEVTLRPGFIKSTTADSKYNLLAVKGALYGESSSIYTPAQAEGATKLHAIEQMIYKQLEEA